jgi:deoxyhypusine synthase
MPTKKEFLNETIQHIDMKKYNVVSMVDDMEKMAFQARNLSRASKIYDMMLADKDCAVILTLAGSLISAGLKQIIVDMIENNMIDAIVSTGANIIDQDFFEALGFKHYIGTQFIDDAVLRDLHIDRIYDTYIDEDDLRVCDDTTASIFNSIEPKPYSSREIMVEFGKYLDKNAKDRNSIVLSAYKKGVPIFMPAFSDCSAGFGIVHHQWNNPDAHVSFDSGKDFLELTRVKIENPTTGIFMIGGGVPKNFTQDIVVAAEVLGYDDVAMHKYAVQLTVADERDGALSGSTLKEASSWGKVDTAFEQMVFGEATVTLPLIAGYGYHKNNWKNRPARNFNKMLATKHKVEVPAN